MKKTALISLLSLLLAAGLLLSGCLLAGREITFARLSLPGGGHGTLFLPKAAAGMAAPGVELLWDGPGELLHCAETALELARRGYGICLVQSGHAREGWDAMCGDARFNPRSMAAGCSESGKSALVSLSESTAEEEYAPRALLFLSTAVPAETKGPGNVLSICPGDATEAGPIDGYFAEGTALRTATITGNSALSFQKAALPIVIDWVGSSLGHPLDGLHADDEFLFPLCDALLFSGAVLFVGAAFPFLLSLRKSRGERA